MGRKTSWKKEIEGLETQLNEKVIESTLSEEEMNLEFNNGYGGSEGKPFCAWTKNYVLFPVVYDGLEWVGFAPRNPKLDTGENSKSVEHQGGE